MASIESKALMQPNTSSPEALEDDEQRRGASRKKGGFENVLPHVIFSVASRQNPPIQTWNYNKWPFLC